MTRKTWATQFPDLNSPSVRQPSAFAQIFHRLMYSFDGFEITSTPFRQLAE
jgi:hypothetical protein